MWVYYTPGAVPVTVKISLRGQDVFNHEIGEWSERLGLWQIIPVWLLDSRLRNCFSGSMHGCELYL